MKGGVYIRTFGCQMNEKDSERMMGLLAERGYSPAAGPGEADVILVNTCSVREKPEKKLFGALGRLKTEKERRPAPLIGVAGCVAQQWGEKILQAAPQVDLVVGTQMIHRLPELIERCLTGERIAAVEWLDAGDPALFAVPLSPFNPKVSAFISIMQGCDNFCAYCIVPAVRGKATSRSVEDILAEARALADAGVKELILLGQNVNAYQDDGLDFPDLLQRAADIPGIERVRFTTSHPKDLDDKLIETMASHPRIMEHIHLPAQAGSDRVLKRMNRGYTRDHYLALVEKLRRAMPGLGITADLIVGFPGESEEDFQDTLSLLEAVRYDETFSFRFSKRPGTKAADFSDQVDEDEKFSRLYRLQDLQRQITEEKNQAEVGKVHQVLVEEVSKRNPERMSGRSRTNRLVHVPAGSARAGELVKARITRALKHSLEGDTIVESLTSGGVREEEACLWK